jgi:hypothetical protein
MTENKKSISFRVPTSDEEAKKYYGMSLAELVKMAIQQTDGVDLRQSQKDKLGKDDWHK